MLVLYDDVFSPYARKVRIALYEKGIAFERVRALHGDCSRTDFVDVNPRAEVPALSDDDSAIYDSTVICEYLEDVTQSRSSNSGVARRTRASTTPHPGISAASMPSSSAYSAARSISVAISRLRISRCIRT